MSDKLYPFNRKGKVGEIIYPLDNGTAGFFKKSRWDLVMETNKDGNITHVAYIDDWSVVRAIHLIQELRKRKAI